MRKESFGASMLSVLRCVRCYAVLGASLRSVLRVLTSNLQKSGFHRNYFFLKDFFKKKLCTFFGLFKAVILISNMIRESPIEGINCMAYSREMQILFGNKAFYSTSVNNFC